jgi:hypothetical protein
MLSISQDYTVLLPPETLLHIASYIDKPSDLISLAHTNSTLRSYAVARLYARICLYRWSAKTIDVLDHLAKYPLHIEFQLMAQISRSSIKRTNIRVPSMATSR